ncbi:MAG: hypothetical protein E7359_04275 [Clostridiales bacterium]|nr:hypothetical protein [Clostridiales bacterium]
MLLAGAFINNIVNTLIRNLDDSTRTLVSAIFIISAVVSFYFALKNQPKDKPGLKLGWIILCIVSIIMSVLYLVL